MSIWLLHACVSAFRHGQGPRIVFAISTVFIASNRKPFLKSGKVSIITWGQLCLLPYRWLLVTEADQGSR